MTEENLYEDFKNEKATLALVWRGKVSTLKEVENFISQNYENYIVYRKISSKKLIIKVENEDDKNTHPTSE